jgi:hypothetical protein
VKNIGRTYHENQRDLVAGRVFFCKFQRPIERIHELVYFDRLG